MWSHRDGPVLCLVTDRARLGGATQDDTRPLLALIAAAVDVGIDLVQVREADLGDRALVRLVTRAATLAERSSTRIVVNDRFDIALAAGAHGVHLKSRSVPAERLRPHVPAEWIVGRSVHSLAEAQQVTAEPGLDYVVLGTVFPTRSKPGQAPLGVEPLRRAAAAVPVPILAIGGITPERVAEVARSGAAGIAAIGLFADLHNSTLQEFRRSVDKIRQRWEM